MRRKVFLQRRSLWLSILMLGPFLAAALPPGRTGGLPEDSAAPAGDPYLKAAAALRRRDCGGALAKLSPLISERGQEASFAGLVSGLYAHSCEQVALSEQLLFAAASPTGPLEDWRLYILSDTARAQGHVLLAKAALARLLGDLPNSPLRPRAELKAAGLDWDLGDPRGALDLVRQARREGVRGEEGTRLEALAWEIGSRTDDAAARTEAARHLLIDSPATAAQLKVVDALQPAGREFSWAAVLNPEQLKRRAQALLAMQLEPGALSALEAVERLQRDLEWHLLKAHVLAQIHRGQEALAMLAPLATASPKEMAALEYARAMAATDAATAQRGRQNPAAAERQGLRLAARQHLQQVVQLAADPELSIKALRLLYLDAVEDNVWEQAMACLKRLRTLDATDTTGAAHLWGWGWQEYERGNYTGAIGYWAELIGLYPDDPNGRRGRYWTGRAYDALGDAPRAKQIYTEVAAADTDDFYRRSAEVRLSHRPSPPMLAAARGASVWPEDPLLARARLLSDLGLDDLALSEIDLLRDRAQPQARAALEAVILARKGDRKKSVQLIREAFPALGGPFQGTVPEAALRLYYPLDYAPQIRASAAMNGVPPYLVFGIIRQESAFDTRAQSWAGARGLMQLMPDTARELARGLGLSYRQDLLVDPSFNTAVGTAYFRQVLRMFDGNLELALAGYNGGPYRIKRMWHESPSHDLDRFLEGLSIEESKTYVKRILVLSDSYRQLYPGEAG